MIFEKNSVNLCSIVFKRATDCEHFSSHSAIIVLIKNFQYSLNGVIYFILPFCVFYFYKWIHIFHFLFLHILNSAHNIVKWENIKYIVELQIPYSERWYKTSMFSLFPSAFCHSCYFPTSHSLCESWII